MTKPNPPLNPKKLLMSKCKAWKIINRKCSASDKPESPTGLDANEHKYYITPPSVEAVIREEIQRAKKRLMRMRNHS